MRAALALIVLVAGPAAGRQKWKDKRDKKKTPTTKATGAAAPPAPESRRPPAEDVSDLWSIDALWKIAEGERCWGRPKDAGLYEAPPLTDEGCEEPRPASWFKETTPADWGCVEELPARHHTNKEPQPGQYRRRPG